MELTERNHISIFQLIAFSIFLIISIVLCIRHGFKRNAGWLFLTIFSLVRIIGAILQLLTIYQPDNISLYIAVFVLQSIGLSYFLIILFALIRRLLEGIEKTRKGLIPPSVMRVTNILILVAVILGAIGGPSSSSSIAETGEYTVSDLSKTGIVLTVVLYGILVFMTAVIELNISYVEPGEKRLLLAVALSLPSLLLRVLYSAIGAFNPESIFNPLTGRPKAFLGAAVIQEIIIVAVIEGVGLTLKVQPKSATEEGRPRTGFLGFFSQRFSPVDREDELRNMNRNSDPSHV